MPKAWHQIAKTVRPLYRTSVDGDVFDSKDELNRWGVLRFAEKAGLVQHLRRQVKFPLVLPNGVPIRIRSPGFPKGRACSYAADYTYEEWQPETKTWLPIVEERKSWDDPTSRLRRAVVEAIYNIEIRVTGPAAKKTKRRTGSGFSQIGDPLPNVIQEAVVADLAGPPARTKRRRA